MLIIGLTGSIGMGKSTAAKHFRALGLPVFDADAEVHRLYEAEAAPLIAAAFRGTVADGRVDRQRLSAAVVGDKQAMARLEALIHPLVRDAERRFLRRELDKGTSIAVLEIPLLFETGGDGWVDVTIVMTAGDAIQRERVLARSSMTAEKLARLLAQQMSDVEKREKANFVVDTSGSHEATARELDKLIESLEGRNGAAIERWLE